MILQVFWRPFIARSCVCGTEHCSRSATIVCMSVVCQVDMQRACVGASDGTLLVTIPGKLSEIYTLCHTQKYPG